MKSFCTALFLVTTFFPLACKQEANQPAEELQAKIIKANEELLNLGNIEYADQVFAPEYRGQGPDMIKGMVTQLRTAFPDLQVNVDLFVREGNMISWRRTHTGTHQAEIFGFSPTGKKITWISMITSKYENGLVVDEWGASDLGEKLCEASESSEEDK